ncbi:hypothetical protein LZ480_16650 [Solibacillus sp. MA9]|uniref:Uncharacterized protein n=1 Tax=Solibacillus palustris TaxID=2908203 RepID=A0ABS9UGM9_9BACL|nr:hypothetical protein [Solibacillus sp. MA9]
MSAPTVLYVFEQFTLKENRSNTGERKAFKESINYATLSRFNLIKFLRLFNRQVNRSPRFPFIC